MTIKQQGGIFGRNPSFNDVEVNKLDVDNIQVDGNTISSTNTNGNVTITPDGSGRVVATNATIGGTDNSNPSLIVHSSNTNNAYLKFGSTGNVYGIIAGDYQGQMNLYTGNHDITFAPGGTNRIKFKTGGNIDMVSGGGNVLFASGAGIDFSATSGTGTSELFSDYEEGNWTPAIEIYGTPGTYTATTSGIYTKVGNLVTVTGRLINVTESVAGGADYFKITGLPFTDIAGYSSVGSVSLGNWNVPACYNAFVTFDSTGSRDYIIMGLNVDNGATDYLDKTHLVSGTSDIEFTLSYFT